MEQTTIQITADAELVNQARAILEEIGLNLETVVSDFLRHIVREMSDLCTTNSHTEALNQEEMRFKFSASVDNFVADLFRKS